MPSPNNYSSTSPAPISINRFTSPASRISPRRSISVSAPVLLRHSREMPAGPSCRSSAAAWRRTPLSIVPIEGEEFTKRLLTPFQETKFILLLRQRYDIDLMLRLMTQELRIRQNGEEIAYRNRPADRTEYEMFRRVVSRLSAIQDQNQLHAEPFVYHRTWTISANSVTAEGFQALQKEYLVTYSQKDNTYTLRKQIIGRTLITNYDPDILSPDERAIWSTKRRKGISTMCPSTSARSASEGTTLSREISGCEASIPFSTFCADRLKKTPNTTSTKIRAPRRSTKIPSTPWNSCCWMERPRESTCRFSPMENITP